MVSSISGMGHFNASSLAQVKEKMFNMIDTNGDGKVDKSEMQKLLANAPKGSSSVEDIFSAVDSDQDGTISKDEFGKALSELGKQMSGSGPSTMMQQMGAMGGFNLGIDQSSATDMKEQIFNMIDTNGDGKISKDEMSQMQANAPAGRPSADEMFSKIDTNQDGSISKAESDTFIDKMAKHGGPGGPGGPGGAGSVKNSQEDTLKALLDALSKDDEDGSSASSSTSTSSSKTDIKAIFDMAISSYMKASTASYSQEASNESSLAWSWSA